ncbi:MAG: hypothetical protein N0C90_23585 [Candidatus Thiodiazotropha endolucinida]|nr:hypothetical protein [Candidatus Thiodiazotropha taylori]MCW4264335.1 hypothetical protein [Candidatus Thiodiazotropha endolucinida]
MASVSLDKEWLYQNIVQGGTQISENSRHLPVSYDSFRHALTIQGKSSWHITGPKQQKAVQYMVKQAENNRWELAAKEILDATKENGQVGGARTMDSLFSSSLEWQDYIKKIKRGIYALKLD